MSETLIRLKEGTRTPARCRGCAAPIEFFDTLTNRHMPMNAGATPKKVEGEVGYYAADDAHWASCPRAGDFGRKRR